MRFPRIPAMRDWIACAALVVLAGGCITETRIIKPGLKIPGAVEEPSPEDTTAAKQAKARRYIEELALEDVSTQAQATRTIFLVKQLTELLPFSTPPMLEDGITSENAKVRENCAFVLCYANDSKAEEALVGLLDDPVEAVRLSAAASLVTGYSNRAGVPPLLRALYSPTRHFRNEAIKNLRIFTQQYFAYHPDAPRAEREFSAKKWQDWWRGSADTFQPPLRGPR